MQPVAAPLAQFLTDTSYDRLPEAVRHAARRCIVDGVGVALAGARHESVDLLLRYCQSMGGAGHAAVWGRSERLPIQLAALVNGHAEHVHDFDDSYIPPETVLHPTVPVLPAVFALAEHRNLGGRGVLRSTALGIEACSRLAIALGRAHYVGGWHVTATAGPVGGAVAAGTLIGLDPAALVNAMGIAVTHAGGVTAMFGTMSKPYHAGKAAEAGARAALLAELGFDSAAEPFDHPQGYLHVPSSDAAVDRFIGGLGETWLIHEDGFKPYPSGVVSHPVIDAMLALRAKGVRPEDVESVHAEVDLMVVQMTGQATPSTGLAGKFSSYHCAAVALIDGAAGIRQFTDERVNAPDVVALRERVRFTPTDARKKGEALLTATLRDGRVLTEHVVDATGTAKNPMSDSALSAKFLQNAEALPHAAELMDRLWHIDEAAAFDGVARLLAA